MFLPFSKRVGLSIRSQRRVQFLRAPTAPKQKDNIFKRCSRCTSKKYFQNIQREPANFCEILNGARRV